MAELEDILARFAAEKNIRSKGPLSVMLIVTRRAIFDGLPLDPSTLLSERGGQVAGLSGTAAQKILRDYGIDRSLGTEGGRTSRGSMENMKQYVALLNSLKEHGLADLRAIERWWIDRALDFFASQPFRLRLDPSKSIRSVIRDLLAQALKRQRETGGTMVAGAMLQHLVGAKLIVAVPDISIVPHGFSVADAPSDRPGDFVLGDTVIHATMSPTEGLIRKCLNNIEAGHRPVIVTVEKGVAGAEVLLQNEGIDGRVDVFEIEQFLATNLYELSKFDGSERPVVLDRLLQAYNDIIEEHETDPGLRIELA